MAGKILIVDNEMDTLKLVGLMLERYGYQVIKANLGAQALEKVSSEHPDLIMLDVVLRDMDGLEVCRQLRANPATTAIPIIIFTARTLVDEEAAGFAAGADDYLGKPTHPAELDSHIKALLNRS